MSGPPAVIMSNWWLVFQVSTLWPPKRSASVMIVKFANKKQIMFAMLLLFCEIVLQYKSYA